MGSEGGIGLTDELTDPYAVHEPSAEGENMTPINIMFGTGTFGTYDFTRRFVDGLPLIS